MAEYITTDGDGKVLRREPKGRGRPRAGYEQKADGNWYGGAGVAVAAAPLKPTRPQLIEDDDDDEIVEPVIATQSDSPDENKIGTLTKIKGAANVTVAQFLLSLHYTPARIDVNVKRIRIRGGVIPQKDLVPGVKFNAVYSQLIIDLTTGNVEILDNSPEFCEVSNKRIIFDALTNVKPEEWQSALRR